MIIQAKNKYKNLKGNWKFYCIFTILLIIGITNFIINKDVSSISSIMSVFFCIIVVAGFFVMLAPPKIVTITIEEDFLEIDKSLFEIRECIYWSMIDLGEYFEFIIKIDDNQAPYYYFYVQKNNSKLVDFIFEISELIPYDEKISTENFYHSVVRFLNLG